MFPEESMKEKLKILHKFNKEKPFQEFFYEHLIELQDADAIFYPETNELWIVASSLNKTFFKIEFFSGRMKRLQA